MGFYDDIAADALDVLAEFGTTVTITRDTRTTDPVTGAATGGTTTAGTFTVVNPPAYSAETSPFDDDTMGEAALIGDDTRFLVVTASGAPFAPAPGDVVTMDGRDWRVLGVTPVAPAGVPVVYRLGMTA